MKEEITKMIIKLHHRDSEQEFIINSDTITSSDPLGGGGSVVRTNVIDKAMDVSKYDPDWDEQTLRELKPRLYAYQCFEVKESIEEIYQLCRGN